MNEAVNGGRSANFRSAERHIMGWLPSTANGAPWMAAWTRQRSRITQRREVALGFQVEQKAQ
ncbi:MAG TPA: hypothetical protein VHK27_09835 [Gammaproteobacteria bacterium]|nr:hypothetical protein [Gammaproteobacteria bacterium]